MSKGNIRPVAPGAKRPVPAGSRSAGGDGAAPRNRAEPLRRTIDAIVPGEPRGQKRKLPPS